MMESHDPVYISARPRFYLAVASFAECVQLPTAALSYSLQGSHLLIM
jgi:hypothetical protein